MTEVAFHFNAPDKLSYACRVLRKACSNSAQVVVRGADELIAALGAKLIEEAREAAAVVHSRTDLVEELADVREVIAALMAAGGITDQEVANAAVTKAEKRGSFRSGAWLHSSSFKTD